VLFPENRTENSGPILVQWYKLPGEAGKWCPIDGIVWDGSDKLDAAIVVCPFPAAVRDLGHVADIRPQPHDQWASFGFPEVGAKDDLLTEVPMIGKVNGYSGQQVDLGVEFRTPLPGGWRGASGGPVFVNGRIVGVISECPENWDQQRLFATPVWRLLEDEGFRGECGIRTEGWRHRIVLRRRVMAKLDNAPAAAAYLGQSFGCEVGAVFDKMMNHRVGELLPKLHDAYKSSRDGGEIAAAEVISDLTKDVVPEAIDPAIIEQIRSHRDSIGVAILQVQIATETACEAALAGADGRSIALREPESGLDELSGTLCIPMPPQWGFRSQQQFELDFENHLISEIDPAIPPQIPHADKLKSVVNRLRRLNKTGKTRYLIVNSPSDDCEIEPLKLAIDNLNKKLMGTVPFILLAKQNIVLRMQEQETYDYLCMILYNDVWSGG
jgi:hypothetical protein